ncbi:MAG: putative LPS assembly protein LptD [Candidatus Kapabacteria bacterium]|nr:putative LPS assembly protein LptD [Candidatus Kapabacteria bacterium]MCX7936441.1 putative LPS assembly protein LptD [Chlorobiota bacterium]
MRFLAAALVAVTLCYAQQPDTLRVEQDTRMRRSGTDSIIVARARDSAVFEPPVRLLRLYGKAHLRHRQQALDAGIIEIDFQTKSLRAQWARDSLGKRRDFPLFSDQGKQYAGEQMSYNFLTGRGTVTVGETSIESGFYFGAAIHKADSATLYVAEGCYTTCDAPHPHFFFRSPRMKVIPGDRVFLQDIEVVVEDVPVFYLPIGMVFPNRGGRQSGFLTPQPAFSAQRGVMLANLGYYWAASDYTGVLLAGTYYSKGGYEINATVDYALRYTFNGQAALSFANVRLSTLEPYSQQYRFRLNHQHTFSPATSFTANIDLLSQGYIAATQFALNQRILGNVTSSAGLSHTFESGIGVSLNYLRNQSITTAAHDNRTTVSLTVPSFMPLRDIVPSSHWLSTLTISYAANASAFLAREIGTLPLPYDSIRWSGVLQHTPSITVNPRLGYFAITPTLSIRANTYPRRITRSWSVALGRTVDRIEYGVFNEYAISAGVSARTTLYGKPLFLGPSLAIRHTVIPTISLRIAPDLSAPSHGFYDWYTIPADSIRPEQRVQYSRFALDGGGIAPRGRTLGLDYTIDNAFDAKRFTDTTGQKIELFRFSVSGSYNFAADSFRLSDQNWTFRFPTIANLTLSSSMRTTFYDEAPIVGVGGQILGYRSINRFRAERLGVFSAVRITSFTLNFSTSFNQSGIMPASSRPSQKSQADTTAEQLGERFRARLETQQSTPDIWGQSSPGWAPPVFPWDVTLNVSYSYSRPFEALPPTEQFNLSAAMNVQLTQTWNVSAGFAYDVFRRDLNGINIRITKQLHCWAMSFVWYPVGINSGFYLVLNPIASVLRDLRIEKRSTPIFQ